MLLDLWPQIEATPTIHVDFQQTVDIRERRMFISVTGRVMVMAAGSERTMVIDETERGLPIGDSEREMQINARDATSVQGEEES